MEDSRSALITGASGGIGCAVVKMLAQEGYALTITGRNREKLDALRREVAEISPVNVQVIAGSILDFDFLKQLVELHVDAYGAIDVLVNNAGVVVSTSIADEADDEIELQLNSNLRAVIALTRNSIPHLLAASQKRGKAHVINTASNAGVRGEGTIATYSAAKAGVIAFTEAIHQEYSLQGIRATAICPGLTDSSMTEMYRSVVSQDQMVHPHDIAEGIRFVIRCVSNCIIPELVFLRDQEWLDSAPEHAE